MSLPYVLAQGILVGKVMSDDKTNWKVLIPYTCQFLIGNVRQDKILDEGFAVDSVDSVNSS